MTPTELELAAGTTSDSTESITPRIAANRINCQSSTGPRTDDGKNRVRLNALQHGLYAASAVIPGESEEEYLQLGAVLAVRFQPHTAEDKERVAAIHDAQWRLKRVIGLETQLLVLSAAKYLETVKAEFGSLEPEILNRLAVAAAYRADSRIFAQLNRQEAKLRKLIDTNTKFLEKSCLDNAASADISEPEDAEEPVGFVPTRSLATGPEPEIEPAPASAPSQSAPKMPKFSGPQAAQHRKNWLRKQRKAGNLV